MQPAHDAVQCAWAKLHGQQCSVCDAETIAAGLLVIFVSLFICLHILCVPALYLLPVYLCVSVRLFCCLSVGDCLRLLMCKVDPDLMLHAATMHRLLYLWLLGLDCTSCDKQAGGGAARASSRACGGGAQAVRLEGCHEDCTQ